MIRAYIFFSIDARGTVGVRRMALQLASYAEHALCIYTNALINRIQVVEQLLLRLLLLVAGPSDWWHEGDIVCIRGKYQ